MNVISGAARNVSILPSDLSSKMRWPFTIPSFTSFGIINTNSKISWINPNALPTFWNTNLLSCHFGALNEHFLIILALWWWWKASFLLYWRLRGFYDFSLLYYWVVDRYRNEEAVLEVIAVLFYFLFSWCSFFLGGFHLNLFLDSFSEVFVETLSQGIEESTFCFRHTGLRVGGTPRSIGIESADSWADSPKHRCVCTLRGFRYRLTSGASYGYIYITIWFLL